MNKQEFIAKVTKYASRFDNIDKKTVEIVINEAIEVLRRDPNLTIRGFASLRVVKRRGRMYNVPGKGVVFTRDKRIPALRPSPAWLRLLRSQVL